MDTCPSSTYQFGPFRLELSERRLLREGHSIALRTKVFDTLRVLVEHSGRLLTKHELMQAIWPDTAVEENNLNHNISTLRRALGEQVTGQRYIETVPRVGYRFVADVSCSAAAAPIPMPAPPAHQGGASGRKSDLPRQATASASPTRRLAAERRS
jgi:DNA-binding winged helix-turn-helix (wHTH) protein